VAGAGLLHTRATVKVRGDGAGRQPALPLLVVNRIFREVHESTSDGCLSSLSAVVYQNFNGKNIRIANLHRPYVANWTLCPCVWTIAESNALCDRHMESTGVNPIGTNPGE
jgi:hypothetical protein